ncbi:hypothetical protein HRI_003586800 [Hibiscus trionum]|uniref:Uncharacterized protein n=1 Tax=Hibiscus trionum TaxID=183268 RepID=A0A9W7IPW7_HIBTR|nr:hypothetical protein HRI_003586800 [Hibiscus trionum]
MELQMAGKEVELQGLQSGSLQLIYHKTCYRLLKVNNSPWTAAIWMLEAQLEMKTSKETMPIELHELMHQSKEVFAEPQGLPPERGHDHNIDLIDERAVVKVRPYRHPTSQKDEIEKLVSEMLNDGIIRNDDSAFSSHMVMVKKKDVSWRMCVDYRKLNQATVKDSFPMLLLRNY